MTRIYYGTTMANSITAAGKCMPMAKGKNMGMESRKYLANIGIRVLLIKARGQAMAP